MKVQIRKHFQKLISILPKWKSEFIRSAARMIGSRVYLRSGEIDLVRLNTLYVIIKYIHTRKGSRNDKAERGGGCARWHTGVAPCRTEIGKWGLKAGEDTRLFLRYKSPNEDTPPPRATPPPARVGGGEASGGWPHLARHHLANAARSRL